MCGGGERRGQRYVGSLIATNVRGAWGNTSACGAGESSCNHSNLGVQAVLGVLVSAAAATVQQHTLHRSAVMDSFFARARTVPCVGGLARAKTQPLLRYMHWSLLDSGASGILALTVILTYHC